MKSDASIKICRLPNQLMGSNCYIIYEDGCSECIVIDPASEQCQNEIEFLSNHGLTPAYIFLTHEHTDHTWGVNRLVELYNPKVVCTRACHKNLNKVGNAYFRLYFDDPNYSYSVKRVDINVEDIGMHLSWQNHGIKFISSPGHSSGSMCILIGKYLFTGDTWMPFKPFFDKVTGDKEIWAKSIDNLKTLASHLDLTIYPGHGDCFKHLTN